MGPKSLDCFDNRSRAEMFQTSPIHVVSEGTQLGDAHHMLLIMSGFPCVGLE